jgi:triphosphoribosyl-dephospho-CoA synthase
MMRPEAAIAAAFEQACHDELEAPKPGNVHVFAGGHGATAQDFLISARAAAPFIARADTATGERIQAAVEASLAAVGWNTNLGIVLLCAPLAAAAERGGPDLRAAVGTVLASLDLDDARLAFEAIRRAAPGGLGEAARHDVHRPAETSLLEAMVEAAPRDRIAWQYAHRFANVFEIGLPALRNLSERGADGRLGTLAVYLSFLAAFPDTHVVRKLGIAVAQAIMPAARTLLVRVSKAASLAELQSDLMAFDAALKRGGINPGTSADLTVATLFAAKLQIILRQTDKSG